MEHTKGIALACEQNGNFLNAMMNIEQYSQMLTDPSAVYKPKIYPDGNMWCCLYGDNIQEGVAGFGSSPNEAVCNFNKEWFRKKTPATG